MKKLFNLIVTLLVAAMFATSAFSAQQPGNSYNELGVEVVQPSAVTQSDLFEITKVEVEGVEIGPTDLINIERGENLNVRVELRGLDNADDVRIKAWIGGYEYDDIEDETSIFDVKKGVTYVKNLVLEIPDDVKTDVKDDDSTTLRIEAFNADDDDELEFPITIKVSAKRHSLNFVDVIFNPGLTVKNTQPLFVTVRLENLGDKKEDDVKVEVSIPELGISQRTYIDELVSVEDSNSNDDDEETSSSSDTLLLDLSNVKPGTYDAIVKATYNRGHDVISNDYQLTVTSGSGVSGDSQDLIIQAVQSSMNVNAGGSAIYTFSIANLGSTARTLSFEVAGQEAWSTARVEPMSITVLPDSTRDIQVTLNAKSDADDGNRVFIVRVKDGSTVVKELQFDAAVKSGMGNISSLRSGLEIGFIVLLVILVILGIVLAVNKMKGKEEGGESYY